MCLNVVITQATLGLSQTARNVKTIHLMRCITYTIRRKKTIFVILICIYILFLYSGKTHKIIRPEKCIIN